MARCEIHLNTVGGMGGGIAVDLYATPTIRDCSIHDNTASSGGGICISASGGTVESCSIADNAATFGGGVALMSGLGVDLRSCDILRNESVHSGGGLYASDSSIDVTECTIADNSCQGSGGAMFLLNTSATVQRTEILRNTAVLSTGGILLDTSNISATAGEIVGNGVGVALIGAGRSLADARHNWWGDDSGPYHPELNPQGQGDEVGNGVQFMPWNVVTGIGDITDGRPVTWSVVKSLYR